MTCGEEYIERYASMMPTHNRLYGFLKTALDLSSPQSLYSVLAIESDKTISFVPAVTVRASVANTSLTAFHVLSKYTLSQLRGYAWTRMLTEYQCKPLLIAVQVNLLKVFEMPCQQSCELTRYIYYEV